MKQILLESLFIETYDLYNNKYMRVVFWTSNMRVIPNVDTTNLVFLKRNHRETHPAKSEMGSHVFYPLL